MKMFIYASIVSSLFIALAAPAATDLKSIDIAKCDLSELVRNERVADGPVSSSNIMDRMNYFKSQHVESKTLSAWQSPNGKMSYDSSIQRFTPMFSVDSGPEKDFYFKIFLVGPGKMTATVTNALGCGSCSEDVPFYVEFDIPVPGSRISIGFRQFSLECSGIPQ